MIDFRYHLVSIIAVFMALAVGIVLGSGPLKDPIDNTINQQAEQLRQERNELREELTVLEQQGAYFDELIGGLAPRYTTGALDGNSVVVVTVPGADPELAGSLTESLTDAGATVTGSVGITDSWLDPANENELDSLVTELIPPGTAFPEDADARARASTVLARSIVGDDLPAERGPEAAAQALLAGLEDLDYVTVEGTPADRAGLALVVAPPAPDTPDDVTNGQNAAIVDLAAALDRQGRGTLVAGPVDAAVDGGLLSALRGAEATRSVVSTVDFAQSAAGRMTVVLGLAAETGGESAAYGFGPDSDAVLPDLEPAPAS